MITNAPGQCAVPDCPEFVENVDQVELNGMMFVGVCETCRQADSAGGSD